MAPSIIPIRDDGLGNTAWLVDLGDGGALVVDPERMVQPYLDAADDRGLAIRFAADTHLHADFVSGGRELAATGTNLLAPRSGDYGFTHRGLDDGDEVELGGLVLRTIATPGHTPEHVAYLLLDGSTPVALFSGGTLMAGAVARPDLVSPEHTEPLARAAHRSITTRLFALPDDLPVYPTHGGGSFCATGASATASTTIGQERATNPLLQAPDEDAFVRLLLDGLGSYPPYFLRLRQVNRRGPRLVGRNPPGLPALDPATVADALANGTTVIDARPIERFAAGHVPDAISIELRGQFGTWLGWLVDLGTPIVVVLDDDQDEREVVGQALTVGHEHLLGRLDGGMEAWRDAGQTVATIPILEPAAVGNRQVVDVRQDDEWEAGHLSSAIHRELGSLADDGHEVLPTGSLLTHCAHGQRAMTGASLLARAGHRDVATTSKGFADLAAVRDPAT